MTWEKTQHVSNDSFLDHDTSYVSIGSRAGSRASSPIKGMYSTLTRSDVQLGDRRDSLTQTQNMYSTRDSLTQTRAMYDPIDDNIHRFIDKASDLMQPKIRDFSTDMYSLGAEFLDKEWSKRRGLYSTVSSRVDAVVDSKRRERSSGRGNSATKRDVSDEKLDMIEERLRLLERAGV